LTRYCVTLAVRRPLAGSYRSAEFIPQQRPVVNDLAE
jgi:hypothetical protein